MTNYWVYTNTKTLYGDNVGADVLLRLMIAALATWISLNGAILASRDTRNRMASHRLQSAIWKTPFVLINNLAILGLMFVGPVMAFIISGGGPNNPAQPTLETLTKFALLGITYVIVCTLFIKSRYVVEPGMVVIMNSLILYPGTRYILWPFCEYETYILTEKAKLEPWIIEIRCRDKILKTEFSTEVRLEIKTAEDQNIQEVDYTSLVEETRSNILKALQTKAQELTAGELILARLPAHRFEVQGIIIEWLGIGTYVVESNQ
ncbi:hypothetical protein HY967_03650 [Candidatus Jorgensenbacteria bacterium]|nr:hypothetical protein [Candidatus Jorgensenbacteria bacterium]